MKVIKSIKRQSAVGVHLELQQRIRPGDTSPHWVGLVEGGVSTRLSPDHDKPLSELISAWGDNYDKAFFEQEIALLNREVSPSETQLKELFQQDLNRWTAPQGGVQFIRDAAFEDLDLALKAEAAFAQIWLDGFNTARELSGAPLVEVDARSLT